jgi:hypothetical protein
MNRETGLIGSGLIVGAAQRGFPFRIAHPRHHVWVTPCYQVGWRAARYVATSYSKVSRSMPNKNPALSAALIVFGAAFCLLIPLSILWSSGWAWHQGGPLANDYFLMIVVVYFTLGIFMIRAAKDPTANASLIWFVVWSSLGHAAIMTWEAVRTPMMLGHLVGDVPALLIAAGLLAALMTRARIHTAAVA